MLFAGTTKGVFAIGEDGNTGDGGAEQVLEAANVRDLTVVDGRLFAGTGSGLFVSDDDGRSWSGPMIEDHEVWQVRGSNAGALFAVTQPAALFRSDDRGDTWVEVESFSAVPEAADWCVPLDPPLPGRARALVIDEHDPDRMWVGVEVGGLARTADGGQTWTVELPGDNPDLHMMWAHPAEPGVLFISTGYGRFDHIAEELEGNAGVFRSEDYGETWDYAWKGVTPRYSRPMCIDRRDPYSLTVASAPNAFSRHSEESGARAALFRSDDHGRSWRSLCDEAHSPSTANIHGLTVDPDNVSGVLIGTDTGEVWSVSDDAAWTELSSGLPHIWSLAAV